MAGTSVTCDIVVVGSGIAGLSAALAAVEAGADVVVVERAARGEHGGNTRYTEAFLRMKSVAEVADDFEERLAENSGNHIDPELMANTAFRDEAAWHPLARSLNFTNAALIGAFSEQAGPTLQWLETFGLRFEALATPFITTSTTRLAPVGGGLAMVETLTAAAEERAVRFEFELTARSLVHGGGGGGGIVGVRGRRRDGSEVEVTGRAVVLASGGFQGNAEMMARYVDRAAFVRPVARGGLYDKGEGIQMALDAGAAPAGSYSLFHAEPVDPRSGVPEAALFIFPYGVLVSREGHRFVDEAPGTVDATYEAITRRILQQPGGMAYVVLDAKVEEIPAYTAAIRTDRPAITAGSLAELADALELPRDDFVATIERFNDACPAGEGFDPLRVDGVATTGLQPPKSNWARPLDTPPFRAYPIMCSNVFSFGGIMVTSSAQVVDCDGAAIGGLYAAGEVMGLYHDTYVGSTSVLRGAVFGRLAGMHAGTRTDITSRRTSDATER